MPSLCSIPLLASWAALCAPDPTLTAGYVEGDYLKLAPVAVSEIEAVLVEEGDKVKQGDLIALLVSSDACSKLAEARAQYQQALASLNDLKLGKRPEEIAVLEATLKSAKAQATLNSTVLERYEGLLDRNVISKAQFDEAETAVLVAQAQVTELEAQLSVAKLPARQDQIAAAQSELERTRANVDLAQWLLGKRKIFAPEPAEVTDIFLRAGEMSGPSAPIASLLPATSVKLTFYVPEEMYAGLKIGDQVEATCSGCTAPITLKLTHLAEGPEFTPPVIYSLETRDKLVYQVQAKPISASQPLRPGQLFDVNLDTLP